MVDMWPESLLREDLESTRILGFDRSEDSFIFEEVHTTGRVDHFTTYLEGDER